MEAKIELYTKISKVKSELDKIVKDSTNPFFKSKYFDINQLLENVEPIIQKHKLLLLQPIYSGEVATEIVDFETGQKITSSMVLPDIKDPQKLGSAITYFRRYTLSSLLGIQAAEDDDGNKAVSKPKKLDVAKALEQIKATKNREELLKLYNSNQAFKTNKIIIDAFAEQGKTFAQ